MKCLVSGATGFIGRQLCQQLVARGYSVLALSKSGASLDSGQSTLAVDLAESDIDVDLLQGVDVFFHLAGIAHQQAGEGAYSAVNYQATVRLARAASAAGIKCFIFLSSVKAMGAGHSYEARAEFDCTPTTDAYGSSKWQAECALREAFSSDSMSVAIVRPALVYGAQVKGNLQSLAAGVRRGLPRPPQGGRRSMIALEDLVELLCVIAQHPPSTLQTWIASGGESYSAREIYDLMRASLGKGKGVEWLPRWVWQLGASLLDRAHGRHSGETYEKLFGTELYSNAAVTSATGWRPRLRLEDVIGRLDTVRSSD